MNAQKHYRANKIVPIRKEVFSVTVEKDSLLQILRQIPDAEVSVSLIRRKFHNQLEVFPKVI